MSFPILTRCSTIALTALLLGSVALAAPSAVGSGQFNLSGSIYASDSGVSFGYGQTGDGMAGVLLPSNGVFSNLKAGDMAHMAQLPGALLSNRSSAASAVSDPAILLANWIQLGNGVNTDLVSISDPTFSEGSSGLTAIWNVTGRAHYADSSTYTPLVGTISANFANGADSTIKGLMTDYASNGLVPTGFAGNFVTDALAGVPEPTSLGLVAFSMLGAAWFGRRKQRQ